MVGPEQAQREAKDRPPAVGLDRLGADNPVSLPDISIASLSSTPVTPEQFITTPSLPG